MTGSPLEPLQHMLISAAIALGSAALTTLSLVMFLRWLGLHWTWTLPGVLLWPLLWSFDQRAAVFAAGNALFATITRRAGVATFWRTPPTAPMTPATDARRWMPAANGCNAA